MKNFPKITVIIPTKNRVDYLKYTLQTCTHQAYQNLVIIVSDDHSTDSTKDLVADFAKLDNRIIYIENQLGSGMRDNFEHALSQVSEGYVIILGSDDGILAGGLDQLAALISKTKSKLITWAPPLFLYPEANNGKSQFEIYFNQRDRWVKSANFLNRQLKTLNYITDLENPMLYVKSAASIDLIRSAKSKAKDNRFYQCSTPDGYSGFVLALEVKEFYFSANPFTLHGLSPKSQGLGYLSDKSKDIENSVNFYRTSVDMPMHKFLASQPYSPLIALMTADFILKTSELSFFDKTKSIISIRSLLKKSLLELSHGMYGDSRLNRELIILYEISKMYQLEKFYISLLKRIDKKITNVRFNLSGANNRAIFLEASKISTNDIFTASIAISGILHIKNEFFTSKIVTNLYQSLIYFYKSRQKEKKLIDYFDVREIK